MDYNKALIYYLVNLMVTVTYSVAMLTYFGRHDTRATGERALRRLLAGIMAWAFYDALISAVGVSGFIAGETAFFLFRSLSIMWLVFGGLAGEQIISLIRPVTWRIRALVFFPFISMYILHVFFPQYTSARVYGINGGWPVFPGPWQIVYTRLWLGIFTGLAAWLFIIMVRERDKKSRSEKAVLFGGVLASLAGLLGSRVLLERMGPGFPALGNASMSFFVLAAFIGIMRYGRVLSHRMLYQTTVRSIPNGLAHVNRGRITWANENFSRMLGVAGRGPAGLDIDEILLLKRGNTDPGESGDSGFLTHHGDRMFLVYTSLIDPGNPDQDILYVVVDVTDRERALEELRKSVGEKEVLLRELQHRVKNNLSLIESYIGLEMARQSDENVKRVLAETRGRVHTVAAIYEELHQAGQVGSIDLRQYLENLTGSISNSAQGKARLVTEAEPVMLDIRRAVSLGIIVNELVTNSIKHAFPGDRKGVIRVTLRKIDGELDLGVSDDGTGFPTGYDFRQSDSMGLKLVELLAKQIGGRFETGGETGTVSHITFPGGTAG